MTQIASTGGSIKIKPPPIKLLKKAMIQRAQSQDPSNGQKNNRNNCSSVTIKTNGSGTTTNLGGGAIKISNKRIQVIQGSKANLSKQQSTSVATKHRHYNSIQSTAPGNVNDYSCVVEPSGEQPAHQNSFASASASATGVGSGSHNIIKFKVGAAQFKK